MAEGKVHQRKKPKVGRPRSEFSEDVLTLLDKAETNGSIGAGTVSDICRVLGISSTVFYKWLKEHKEFSDAVTRTRDTIDDQVENALLKRALGYSLPNPTTSRSEESVKVKTSDIQGVPKLVDEEEEDFEVDGVKVKTSETMSHTHVPPDPGAAKHWLNNRRPDKWAEKRQVQVDGNFAEWVDEVFKRVVGEDDEEAG